MHNTDMNTDMINLVKEKCAYQVRNLMKDDVMGIVLYGSCARGDYTEDSDIDIAILTRSDRLEVKKYAEALAAISTEMAVEHFAIVNFVCLPYDEFQEKKSWYPYFKNIDTEGEVLYG